ncbi:hypothetical protein BB987_16150 [Photorhabdus temperata]|uniref:Uncharacterized protein n=2 Tax=Photorhabdus khanii TaxID=1004150 RepID=W3V7A7_9GAMM|nr:hypothetical protein [Photorhabdus khanii]ETS30995.1 hypothetical protein PTE_02943 [Photorhabdus khanii NC19]MQL47462.1 hypothetical protein [Photorhabdus khanii]OHV51819.1 hypothetical protein BB987_16150 [Photorhabdus temperata]
MSTLTTDIVSGITVLEECPVVITVTYSGDDTHKVTEKTGIVYSDLQDASFDDIPRISRDVEKNTCTAKFVVTTHSSASDFTVTFSMDKDTDPDAKLEITFHPIGESDFSYGAFEPIIIGDSLIKDLSPAEDDKKPFESNGNFLVNIYALGKNNEALPYFQIPLVTDKPVRIFGIKQGVMTEEILHFISGKDNYQYYINTNSDGFVALKVFPKKSKGNYSVSMLTKLPYFLRNASSNILMITRNIYPTLPALGIEELVGDKLTPPIGNRNTGFHVIIPSYKGAKPLDQIFLIIEEGDRQVESQSAVITEPYQLDMPFILVPYASVPNTGDNRLSYYVADANGNITVSPALYFNLTRSVPNVPPEIERTLAVPRIFTHKDQEELGQRSRINLASILGGGLDAHISVGKNNVIDVDSVINVRIYVNGIVHENPSSQLYSPEPHTVTAEEVAAGETIISLGQAFFTGVDSYSDGGPGSVYVTYSVGQKESKIWYGRIDTVPPGQYS